MVGFLELEAVNRRRQVLEVANKVNCLAFSYMHVMCFLGLGGCFLKPVGQSPGLPCVCKFVDTAVGSNPSIVNSSQLLMHNTTFLLKNLLRKHLQLASVVQLSTQ